VSITAKKLAEKLNLSAAAVSMALNNKNGVSLETRQRVIKAAEKYGYDFSRIDSKQVDKGSIYQITYRTHGTIMSYLPIFSEITEGIEQVCAKDGYKLKILQLSEKNDDIQKYIEDIRISDCAGIILLGTEMRKETYTMFAKLSIPIILLDSYFDTANCDSVLINNKQGAYLATDYLINKYQCHPGYMKSTYPIENFFERSNGFYKAVREHGMSVSNCIIHDLPPSIDGAYSDMTEIIKNKQELASCYFADNDLIAIGAVKALKDCGYKIPDDIAVVGFDNISESRIIDPALTTVDVPRQFMGQTAARQLIQLIRNPRPHSTKTEVSTSLIKRNSA
jgi:LacI family transcriptional regulator